MRGLRALRVPRPLRSERRGTGRCYVTPARTFVREDGLGSVAQVQAPRELSLPEHIESHNSTSR